MHSLDGPSAEHFVAFSKSISGADHTATMTGVNGARTCKKLLLIVIFNFPFSKNVPVLRLLYGDVFSKILFYADKADAKWNVAKIDVREGFFQHRVVADAMRRYPSYDGYMWIGDDVLLNYPFTLTQLNMSKLWLAGPDEVCFCTSNVERDLCRQHWQWEQQSGYSAAVNAVMHLPAKFKSRISDAFGNTGCLMKGASDAGYIPAHYVSEFMLLADIFRSVFFEFAIPSTFLLLSPGRESISFAKCFYSWGFNATARFLEVERAWNSTIEYVHPVKLSSLTQRTAAGHWLANARSQFHQNKKPLSDLVCR